MTISELTCKTIRPKLIDYADGELDEAESARIARHLAECGPCRHELERLDRSLALAREVWCEAACRAEQRTPSCEAAPVPRRWRPAAAVLAAVAAAALIAVAFCLRPGPEQRVARQQPASTPAPSPKPAPPVPPDDRAIDDYLDRTARAARLAAAVELLSTQPSLADVRRDAEDYLRRTYADALSNAASDRGKTTQPHEEPKS